MPDVPRLKAEFFRALGHPARIRILEALADGERTVTELLDELAVEQPYLSQQLGVLRRSGLVVVRREGTSAVYALADGRIAEVLSVAKDVLLDLYTATGDELRGS